MSDQRDTVAPDEPRDTVAPDEPGDRSAPMTDTPTQEVPMTHDDALTEDVPRTGDEVTSTETTAPGAATAPRRGIRSGTVLWGLVLAVVGVGLLAWSAGLEFDVQLALIVLIGVAGVALLATSVASVRRRREPKPGA